MRNAHASFLLLCIVLSLVIIVCTVDNRGSSASVKHQSVVAGYYYGGFERMEPSDLPDEYLTHVLYAFGRIDPDTGKVVLANPAKDREKLKELRRRRGENPELKILLSVGGPTYSAFFSDAALNDGSREIFAQSCLDLVRKEELDGLDINWEYPVLGGRDDVIHRAEDKENYTKLLQEIRSVLDILQEEEGKPLFLTATGAPNKQFLNQIEPVAVAQTVDYIFVMAYDFWGTWESRTGLNAPMDKVRSIIEAYLEAEVPGEKLILGIPLYGYRYFGVQESDNGLNAKYEDGDSVTCDMLTNYFEDESYVQYRYKKTPYLYGNGIFISYEDTDSIASKAALARKLGLAGVGFWETSQDREGRLVESAANALKDLEFSGGVYLDVAVDNRYADAIDYVTDREWIIGISVDNFAPAAPLDRGTLVNALYRMERSPGTELFSFPDVRDSDSFSMAASWAVANGIIKAGTNGNFQPNEPVSDGQLLAILLQYARYRDANVPDKEREVGGAVIRAEKVIEWAVGEGILGEGALKETQEPGWEYPQSKGLVSRAETAAILAQLAQESYEK